MNNEHVTPQNSAVRAAFKGPIEAGAEWLNQKFPNLEASHITAAGTLGCLAVAAVSTRYPQSARANSWLHLGLSLTDALDGPVARLQAANEGRTTTRNGALFDTSCDRAQEFFAGLAQSKIAKNRGDKAAQYAQLAFAASSVLPSLTRSMAESKGVIVSEGSLGNRHTRVTLNCLGYFWSDKPNRVRNLGAIGTALNVYNATKRISVLKQIPQHSKGTLGLSEQLDAKARRNVLSGLGILFSSITSYEAYRSRTK